MRHSVAPDRPEATWCRRDVVPASVRPRHWSTPVAWAGRRRPCAAGRSRGASVPGWRRPSRRWPGWCGSSSPPSTATTRSCTTGSWSTEFRSQGVIFVDDVDDVPAWAAAHALGPRLGPRGGRRAARAEGGVVVDAVCPLVTKVHHELKVRSPQGLHGPLRRPRRPRGGRRHDGGGPRCRPPGRARGRTSTGSSSARTPVWRFWPRPPCATTSGRGSWSAPGSAIPTCGCPDRSDLCFATTNRQAALKAMAAES